jgi:tRNA (guanine37-N1)-methyltransferase
MVFIEATARLIPNVISQKDSFIDESYSPEKNMKNIEYPQYTMPQEVYGYKVPDILLSGHHKKIQQRREQHQQNLD